MEAPVLSVYYTLSQVKIQVLNIGVKQVGPPGKAASGCATVYAALLWILMLASGRLIESFIAVPIGWMTVFLVLLAGLWLASAVVGQWWLMVPRSRWREAIAALIALLIGFILFGALDVLVGAIHY